jgi:hypothetical protein
MSQTQVQNTVAAQAAQRGMAQQDEETRPGEVYSLAYYYRWLDNRSRVNREVYARFYERLKAKFLRSTYQ